MLDPEAIKKAENQRHAEQLEQSMLILATVLLRKTGRKRIRLDSADIADAIEAGVAEARESGNGIVYELPSKKSRS